MPKLVVDNSFPADRRGDLNAVAQDVLHVVTARLGSELPAGDRPIVCSLRPEGPHTCPTAAEYQIRLTARDRDYCQFVFQLSHELAHVLMDPRRSNGVTETFAVATSPQALDDLAEKWATDPPYPNWQPYSANFSNYRKSMEKEIIMSFPPEVVQAVNDRNWPKLTEYLQSRRADQDANLYDRPLNFLGAVRLRAEHIPWRQLSRLAALTNPPPSAVDEWRSDLQLDVSKLPAPIIAVLASLGR
jgi:hypothetical protein